MFRNVYLPIFDFKLMFFRKSIYSKTLENYKLCSCICGYRYVDKQICTYIYPWFFIFSQSIYFRYFHRSFKSFKLFIVTSRTCFRTISYMYHSICLSFVLFLVVLGLKLLRLISQK